MDIKTIVKLLNVDPVISRENIYADCLLAKHKFDQPSKPLKFDKEQFMLFTDSVSFKGNIAVVKSKRSSLEIPGEVLEIDAPVFKGKEVSLDIDTLKNLPVVSKEIFITKNYIASPSNQTIIYAKTKSDINCIVSSTFVSIVKELNKCKILISENGLVVVGKEIKVFFPYVSSDISEENITAVIKSSESCGKIQIEKDLLSELAKIPLKEEIIEFAKEKVSMNASILKFSGKIKTSGNVDSKVQLCNLDLSIPEILVTSNALKYKLSENTFKLIPFVG